MLKLAFLASNNGSSMQAIVEAIDDGRLAADARLIVSNKPGSGAVAFGRARSITTCIIATRGDPTGADEALRQALSAADADLVILSGYLRKLGPRTLLRFAGRILNVHPALLPKFGGTGMYGRRVHEAVAAAGEAESGATIHLVDEEYDHGAIIASSRVALTPGEEAANIEKKVMGAEKSLFVEVVGRIARGELRLPLQGPADADPMRL